jgi:5-methylcytosine-specific restriction endonuclease McrA
MPGMKQSKIRTSVQKYKDLKKQLPIWYMYLFDQRKDENNNCYCFECNKTLNEVTYKSNLICYSHLLSKALYPEHMGNPNNIVIVCPDCHNIFSLDAEKAIKQFTAAHNFKEMINNDK